MPICPKCGKLVSDKKYSGHLKRCGTRHKFSAKPLDHPENLVREAVAPMLAPSPTPCTPKATATRRGIIRPLAAFVPLEKTLRSMEKRDKRPNAKATHGSR